MRLVCDDILAGSESFGSPGLAYLKWESPVRAGDALRVRGRGDRHSRREEQAHAGHPPLALARPQPARRAGARPRGDEPLRPSADVRLQRQRARVDDVARAPVTAATTRAARAGGNSPSSATSQRSSSASSGTSPPRRRGGRHVDDQHEFAAFAIRRRRRTTPALRPAESARSSRTSSSSSRATISVRSAPSARGRSAAVARTRCGAS